MKIRKLAALLVTAVFAFTLAAFSLAEDDYGAPQIAEGQQYSWEQMLGIALQEAYRRQAEFGVLAAAFPGEDAFREALNAANEHVQYMLGLCASYGMGPEAGEPPVVPGPPESLQEAFRRLFRAEEVHAYMYRVFLSQENRPEETGGLLRQLQAQAQERLRVCDESAAKLGFTYEYHYGEDGDGSDSNGGEGREGTFNNDDNPGEGVQNNNDPGQEGAGSNGDEGTGGNRNGGGK